MTFPTFKTPKVLQSLPYALPAALMLLATAFAHQTVVVGDGAYSLVAGYLNAPLYAGQIETVEIRVSDAAGEPVENLAGSLLIEVIGPDGNALALSTRAQRGAPGVYLADFLPTVSGNYHVRVTGFIGEVEFVADFDGVEMVHADPVVADPATISLP